jgi:hypothetical protein
MKDARQYLKRELSKVSIESQKITFVTDSFLPFEFTIYFKYVIKNKMGEIVAVGTTFKDDSKLHKFLLKVKAGFAFNIFYQTNNDQLWLLKPKSSEEKIDKQKLAEALKNLDPSLKTENDILIEELRDKLQKMETQLKKVTDEKNELIDNLEYKYKNLISDLEQKDKIIQTFQEVEIKRTSIELDKLENKKTFIQKAIDIYNPSSENQWVDTPYSKNALDKVQTSTWTNNSKIKRFVNFFNETWVLKVQTFDWDGERRCNVLSDSKYFEYSIKDNVFIQTSENQHITFWLEVNLE